MDPSHGNPRPKTSFFSKLIISSLLVPVILAVAVYQLDSFEPAALPLHEVLQQQELVAPKVNSRLLEGAEYIGSGKLTGPEDLVYDAEKNVLYTGCNDGWIKRIKLTDLAVEDLVNTGGRPLGLAWGRNGELIIADSYKGLLNLSIGTMELNLLTDEAEGMKFKMTDGVDVADDGTFYFTDASYKYSFAEFIWDVYEGKPHGRLMSYNPSNKETKVLARDLYLANGVTVSQDQKSVIYCETVMRRCRKYIIEGEQKGEIQAFLDNLVGPPDNIKSDGQGFYWIAISTSAKPYWEIALKYPVVRKVLAMMTKYTERLLPHMERNSGVMTVDLEGKPLAQYYDDSLALISTGIAVGDHLYLGSVHYPHIIRLNFTQHPAI